MKFNIKKIFGIISYIISILLIIYYLILEFSVINVISPINRIIILFITILIMHYGSKLIDKKWLYKVNFYTWFILYLIMLLNLTLFDKYFDRDGFAMHFMNLNDITEYLDKSFNIVPFSTINNYFLAFKNGNLAINDFIYNIFGNLIVFCPLAIFLPRIFKFTKKWYYYFFFVSVVILLIEFMQLLLFTGSCDIDDYILNIFGSLVFYFILKIKKIEKWIDKVLCLNN